MCPSHPALLIMCCLILQSDLEQGLSEMPQSVLFVPFTYPTTVSGFRGVKATAPWLPPAGWGVGAVLLSANHLAPGRLCLGKRPLPGLNYGGNNPGHTEAITAPYKSICFGLKSDLLPTLWRSSDSVCLWFFWEMGAVSLEMGRDAAVAAAAAAVVSTVTQTE